MSQSMLNDDQLLLACVPVFIRTGFVDMMVHCAGDSRDDEVDIGEKLKMAPHMPSRRRSSSLTRLTIRLAVLILKQALGFLNPILIIEG